MQLIEIAKISNAFTKACKDNNTVYKLGTNVRTGRGFREGSYLYMGASGLSGDDRNKGKDMPMHYVTFIDAEGDEKVDHAQSYSQMAIVKHGNDRRNIDKYFAHLDDDCDYFEVYREYIWQVMVEDEAAKARTEKATIEYLANVNTKESLKDVTTWRASNIDESRYFRVPIEFRFNTEQVFETAPFPSRVPVELDWSRIYDLVQRRREGLTL